MHRGRPPSAKTLVDRQLGRNIKHPILPAGDSYLIPNLSGIASHPEFIDAIAVFLKTDGSNPSTTYSNTTSTDATLSGTNSTTIGEVGDTDFGDGTERDLIPAVTLKINVGTASRQMNNANFGGSVFILDGIPTSDPSAAGQLWNDSGTLKVSAG